MDKSEQINELAVALSKSQSSMKSAKKNKTSVVGKGTKVMYADLEAVLEVFTQSFAVNGLSFYQGAEYDELGEFLRTTIIHSSGQWVSSKMRLMGTGNDPRHLGSALTYARRYGLCAMTGIVAGDEDDDGEIASHLSKQEEEPKTISKEQEFEVWNALEMNEETLKLFLKHYKIQDLSQLSVIAYESYMSKIKNKASQ